MHVMWSALSGWIITILAGIAVAQAAPTPPALPQTPPERNKSSQPQPKPKPATREIVLQNLAPFSRRQAVAIAVPFAQGVAFENPMLNVNDLPTVWQPFGARWPDRSWRQALCLFTVTIPRLSEMRLPLMAGNREIKKQPISMPQGKITFVVRRGNKVERAVPQYVRDLEKNAVRHVELRRARIGKTGLVAEVIVTAWRNQRHADISLAVFFSDPNAQAMQRKFDKISVECSAMAIVLRHAGYHGVTQQLTDTGSRSVLLRNQTMGDGQGLRRAGVMVSTFDGNRISDDTLRAAVVAPIVGATSWRYTGSFGPFGVVPAPPSWLSGNKLRQHFANRHRIFTKREPANGNPFFVGPHGLQPMAGQTGDQNDFGICKLSPVAWSGIPSMLLEVEASVLQEACRPVHFFEADASPVDPSEHPDWIVWSGRTHWHAGVSKDRLGKPTPEPAINTHRWTGKDRQHWSSNYLAAYALLTGAHWARLELENEARLYLAGQTIDPRHTTSNAGAPRGAGRVALAAAWNVCVSNNEQLRMRMDERMDKVYWQQWLGRSLDKEQVRPMGVRGPDGRQLRGKFVFWNPWQDAIAACGFAAQHRMTKNAHARELAEQLAINVVKHGWLLDDRGNEVGEAIRWLDGKPFSAEQWQSNDDTLVKWSFDSAFSEWSIGAVEIARVAAIRDGDTALAQKAATIQRLMRQSRRPPDKGYPHLSGFDRFGEWDATSWLPK